MECEQCGRWAPADQETGYDADTICPDCASANERAFAHRQGVAKNYAEMLLALKIVAAMRQHAVEDRVVLLLNGDVMRAVVAAIEKAEAQS